MRSIVVLLFVCLARTAINANSKDSRDILDMYHKFRKHHESFSSLRRRTEEEERCRYDPSYQDVEEYVEAYPERRRLEDYYDCSGYTRPEMLAKFMGIPTTTTITNDTTYVVTLEADVERTGVNFFDDENTLESWKTIEYNGASISILDCGYITDCRENTMTNYFRFSGKSDTDIFPRVDQIVSVTNTTMQVLISSTTENAGPLVMSFMYNSANSSNLCYWTPYQVVAWITATNPSITGMVQGNINSSITDYSSYVLSKSTRIKGSPAGNWLYSDSAKLTIAGTNFATSAGSNLIYLSNNDQWSTTKSQNSYRDCSRVQETWTPDPTSMSAKCTSASDDGTWIVVDFDNLDALNAGTNFNALLYDTDETLVMSTITSIICSEGDVSNASFIGDLDWDTNFECIAASSRDDVDLTIDFTVDTSKYFAARSFRISVSDSVTSTEVPSGNWYLMGGTTCNVTSGSCSSWTTLNTMAASDWTSGVSDCNTRSTLTSIPPTSRDFYEVYRILIPFNESSIGTDCCKITEMELIGTDDSSWITTQVVVQAGTSTYTSEAENNLFLLEPSTPTAADDPDGQQLQVNPEKVEEAYSVTLYGTGFPYIADNTTSNRAIVHIMQAMTPFKCCEVNSWNNTDLDTMRSTLKEMNRYINGTEDDTTNSSFTCEDNDVDITCYFGTSSDSWTESTDSGAVTCPCNAVVESSTNDPGVNGSMVLSIQSGWYATEGDSTSHYTFNIETALYYVLDVQGSLFLSNIAEMVIVQGEPQVDASNTIYTTNLPKLTISGQYFSSTASKNTVSFQCTNTSSCGHNGYHCLGDITGEVVSASSEGTEIVFQIWKWGYYNGCDNEQGSEIQAQVSVEGISSPSEWEVIGYFQSVAPEISNDSLPVLGSDYPYVTVKGYGFAVQSSSSGGSEIVEKSSENLTYSYRNTIITMYQGDSEDSTYTTDSGDSTTLPKLKGSIVRSSRSRLVLSFTDLSPLNQDSIQSGDITMSIETTYAFSDNVENATLSAGPTDAFTVKAENPYVDTWTPENSESCGLVSTSEKLTIKGRGFYSATDDVIEVTFDSTIVNASVVNSTYSHIVISFSELSAVSSGNLSATVSVPSSKCWTDSCYGVCLNSISDYINNANVTAESCANINMASSCTFQCNDEYNASDASMCLRTGDWENTTAQCLRQCDTISNPTNGVLVNCVAPLSSGSTCDITCDSGYSADGTPLCTDGVFDPSSCQANCNTSLFSAPSNGAKGDCTDEDLNHGSYCTMTCNDGYTVSANSTCEDGTLSTVSCLADCDISDLSLGSDQNAGTCTANLTSGSTCEVECQNSDESPSASVTCTNGVLSTVTCLNNCKTTSFTAPSNGNIGNCTADLNHGDTCTMSCDDGYVISGSSTCNNGTLTTVTCDFDPTADISCALSSGFTDSTTTWYGCRSVGTDTENFPFGSCIDTTNRNVPCSSNCNSPCTSDTQLVAIIYPTAPNITADSSNSIVCTEYAVTITGIGFDHNTPSNNIVRLSAQDTSNNAVTSFDGTCEVSEATRTSIVCVFTSLDCDQLDLNYYLLAEVAINLTTVNDGYDATSDCPNFGVTVTEYSDAKIVAIFSSNSPVITASTQTITSSDDEITIYGCNFNILNPDTNKIAFSSSYNTDDVPTGTVKSASRDTGNVIAPNSCTNNYGMIVVAFYKLGPTNIVSPGDSDALKAVVYIECTSTNLCPTSTSSEIVATSITEGSISFTQSTDEIFSTTSNFTVIGLGFDPYTPGNNVIGFNHTNIGTCGTLSGLVKESSRTHLVVDVHSMSTAFKGLVYADSMTVIGVVGNGTSGVGANLTYSGSEIAVATLSQAAPTLDSYTSQTLNSDAVDITLTGMGFDNAATDSSGNYVSNIVTFTASQEGPVTVNPNIRYVTRSTMIVSFWKLNARHVGTLSYKVTLNPFYACSVTATPVESESAVAAQVVAVAPTITRVATNREEIDSEKTTLETTIVGKGFDSTSSNNALYRVTYEGDSGSSAWTAAFSGVAKTASRTQLTVTLGPVVDIDNAGDMYGSVTVSEYEDSKVKTPCALESSCDFTNTHSSLISNCNDGYCDTTDSTQSFIVKIGKGTPTVTVNTATIRSDATCLYVEGTNFAATLDTLVKNECFAEANNYTCNTISTSDLRSYTSNCTELCDVAYLQYRDFTYPSDSSTDSGQKYACTPWGFDFSSAASTNDLQYFDFSSSQNNGVQPEGHILYSSSTDICIYVTKLAQQNAGDLYITAKLETYVGAVTLQDGNCTSYTFTASEDNADYDNATEIIGTVVAVTPVLNYSNSNLSSSAKYITVSGTGFDIANQEYNEISFVNSEITASIVNDWSDATRTRIRFEFWRLDSRHVGDLNASVRAKINSSAYSDYSSTQTIASIVATSPEIDNASTVLVSGTNETAFVVHGSGFVAAPSTSLNYLSLTDGNGGCYANADCSSSYDNLYAMTLVTASRTNLVVSFPIIHRNSTKISLYNAPMSASYVNNESMSATQSPVAYLQLFSECSVEEINTTCRTHGTCYDLIQAPITFVNYVCQCDSGYGGTLCETELNDDQIKCEAMCVDDMETCSSLYYAAATGTNDLDQSAQVSVLNYAEDYLFVNDSDKKSVTYSYLVEDETAAFFQCWKIAQNTTLSSSNEVTALFESTTVSHTFFQFYHLYQVAFQIDVTYLMYVCIFFFIFFCLLSAVQGPIRFFELA